MDIHFIFYYCESRVDFLRFNTFWVYRDRWLYWSRLWQMDHKKFERGLYGDIYNMCVSREYKFLLRDGKSFFSTIYMTFILNVPLFNNHNNLPVVFKNFKMLKCKSTTNDGHCMKTNCIRSSEWLRWINT